MVVNAILNVAYDAGKMLVIIAFAISTMLIVIHFILPYLSLLRKSLDLLL